MVSQFRDVKKRLPLLGVGLGLRRELSLQTLEPANGIDFLELAPENYMGIGGASRELLERAHGRFPLVSHGLNLSLGSTDDLNRDYLRSLKRLLDDIDAPWWSDHLCFTVLDGVFMHDLMPLPFTKEAVKHVAARARMVQDFVERPLLLENISYYMRTPESNLTEAQFLSAVLEDADCGLLLDINNVYVNSLNHHFDPRAFLDAIPLERTVEIHIAGHKVTDDVVIDTHGEPIVQPVFDLLEYALPACSALAIMLERDQNFPDFKEISRELSQIRRIAQSSGVAVGLATLPTPV